MTAAALERAPLDDSAVYRAAYRQVRSRPLRDRLHSLAHDPRIPDGVLRAWALRLMRWRAGDVDHHGLGVLYPAPPSASVDQATIALVDQIVTRELVPDFRGERWRTLRELPVQEDDHA